MKKNSSLIASLFLLLYMGSAGALTEMRTLSRMECEYLESVQVPDSFKKTLDTIFDNQIYALLDKLQSQKADTSVAQMIFNPQGFSVIKYDGNLVCTHEALPGYVLKIAIRPCVWKHNVPNFKRIGIAYALRQVIQQYGLEIFVPCKWAYFSACSSEGVIVVAQEVKKDSRADEKILTRGQFRSLQYLVDRYDFPGVCSSNVFLTEDGELAIIDTEPFDVNDPYFGHNDLGMQVLKGTFSKEWLLYGPLGTVHKLR